MKNFVLIVLFVLGVICTNSCSKTDLKIAEDIRKAESLVLTDPDSASVILDRVKEENLRDKDNQARYRLVKTIIKDRLGITHDSPDDILAAREYLVETNATDSLLAIANLYVGRVYDGLGNSEDALHAYLIAETNLNKTKRNFYWKGRTFYHIGELYHNDLDYVHSAEYLLQAIQYFLDGNDTLNIANSYNLLGLNYSLSDDNTKALDALEKANSYYIAGNSTEGVLSNTLVMVNILLNEPNAMVRADSLMKRTYDRYNNGVIPLFHYPMMSRIEQDKRNFEAAIKYLKDYMDLTSDMPLEEQAAYKYLIAGHYNELRQHSSAYNAMHESVLLMDSLYQRKMDIALQEVDAKYRNQELKREYTVRERYNTYRAIIGSLVFVIIISILWNKARKRRLKNLVLQTDLYRMQDKMSEFDKLEHKLSFVFDKQSEKEKRLYEVLSGKIHYVQNLIECLRLPCNDLKKFKFKMHSAIVDAERNTYLDELYEIVNEKYAGIVDYLNRKFPTLTNEELHLCCLVCFGFSNDQIGILFGYTSLNSVYNKRSKIKRMLDLPHEESLETYFIQTVASLRDKANHSPDNI